MKIYVSNYFDISEKFSQFNESYDANFSIFFWSSAIKKKIQLMNIKIVLKI